jgi:predicted aspartyl protease
VKPNSSSRSSRQYIKLGYYNGKTAVEAFVRKFEVCAENNEWTEKEKLNQLTCALTEPANQLLWEFDSETVMTSSDLIRKLRARYGGSDQTALYQTQLSTRRQKDGEDLGTLVQDVRRLMILGFPGPTTIHSEAIAIRSFLDALRDQDLAMKVREREPETLDNTYNLAMRFEGYLKADLKETLVRDRRPSRVHAAYAEEPDLERFRQLIREELESQRGKNASSDSRQRWGNARGGRMTSGYRRPSDATSWQSTKACYGCGQPGHLVRNCPGQGQLQMPAATDDDLPVVGRVNHVQGSRNAYLTVQVNGTPTHALVDTGCEVCLVPTTMVRAIDVVRSRQRLAAANGTEIRIIGETDLALDIDGQRFSAHCLVTDQFPELILGLTWLEQNRASWHFGENRITIDGRDFPISRGTEPSSCLRITLAGVVKQRTGIGTKRPVRQFPRRAPLTRPPLDDELWNGSTGRPPRC